MASFFSKSKDFIKKNPGKSIAIGAALVIGVAAIGVGIALTGGVLAIPLAGVTAGVYFGGVSLGTAIGATAIVSGAAVTVGAMGYGKRQIELGSTIEGMRRRVNRSPNQNAAKNATERVEKEEKTNDQKIEMQSLKEKITQDPKNVGTILPNIGHHGNTEQHNLHNNNENFEEKTHKFKEELNTGFLLDPNLVDNNDENNDENNFKIQ